MAPSARQSTTPAFALGAVKASSFTTPRVSPATTPLSVRTETRRAASTWRMSEEKKPLFSNPFKAKPDPGGPATSFMAPQAGDPGYVPPPPVPKGTGMSKSEPRPSEKDAVEAVAAEEKPADPKAPTTTTTVTPTPGAGGAKKLPVVSRGLDLLKKDLFKSAPESVGVGRQDTSGIMKPMAGEPGYKPAAYQTVPVSELGISPFPDDANAVGNVGGVEAVKKAALEVKEGLKSAKEVKKEVTKAVSFEAEPKKFDIPDYLKPLPEDTPRRGLTWKNYVGR